MKKNTTTPTTPKTPRRAASPGTARPRRTPATKPAPSSDDIALRAYEIYLSRNGAPGDPLADWLQAEQELMPRVPRPRRRPASA